jgi:hypothetical protein
MSDLFHGESGAAVIGLAAILIFGGGPLCIGAWALWLKHRKNERQDEMKRDMLERGMSADEIVRVLNAGSSPQSTPTGAKASPPNL